MERPAVDDGPLPAESAVEAPPARTPRLTELIQPGGRPEAAWWRGALIGAGALLLALATLLLTWQLARPLLLLFAAITLAEAVSPVVGLLKRWLPRGLAVVLVFGVLLVAVGVVGWLLVPPLVEQAQALVNGAPALIDQAEVLLSRWDPAEVDRVAQAAEGQLGTFAAVLVALPLMMLSSFLEIVLVAIMAIYWLLAAPEMRRFSLSFVPAERQPAAVAVLDEIGRTIGGFVRGEGVTAVVSAAITYVGLLVLGLDYPLVLALLSGLAILIPIIGPFLAVIPAAGVALLESPTKALIVIVFYVVVQQLQYNVLLPYVLRSQAAVPPLLAVFALVAGTALAGGLGAIIAIPLAGAVRVLLLRVAAPALRRWTGVVDWPADETVESPEPTPVSANPRVR